MKNKKLLMIIGIVLFLIVSVFITIYFVNKYKENHRFDSIITTLNDLKEDENLYIKIVIDEVNVRYSRNVSYNKIGTAKKNDVYLVEKVNMGDAYYWYFIVDAEGNEGFIASGREELYIETFIKNKSEEIQLSTIGDYNFNKQIEDNPNSEDNDFTIEYTLNGTTKDFNHHWDEAVIVRNSSGERVEPEKLYYTCKEKSKDVDCDYLDEEKSYNMIIHVKYNGKMITKSVKLKGSGSSSNNTYVENNNSTNNANNVTTTTTQANTTTTQANTTTNTTTSKPEFTMSGHGGISNVCTSSGCGSYILFEVKASGGSKPYKYSITASNVSGEIVDSTTSSKLYIPNKKGMYRFDFSVEDSDGNKKSDSKMLNFN